MPQMLLLALEGCFYLRVNPAFTLATGAEKCTSLGLDDSANRPPTTAGASVSGSIVDSVIILIAAFGVEGISVRTIAERAPLQFNRFLQDDFGGLLDSLPLRTREDFATTAWIHTGQE